MLIAQKITKKNTQQLKEAARELAKIEGKEAIRASMSMFAGNTVYGIFDGDKIVGWKVSNPHGKIVSEIGTTTAGNDDVPIFEHIIDPFTELEEKVDEEDVEETLCISPEEQLGREMLQNAQRADVYLKANPNAGRKRPPKGGYVAPNDPSKNKPKMSAPKVMLACVLTALVVGGAGFTIFTAYNQLQSKMNEAGQMNEQAQQPDWDAYQPVPADAFAHVQITSGDDIATMRDKLLEMGFVESAKNFETAVAAADAAASLQAGDYIIAGNESAESIVDRMTKGKRAPVGVIGINEGDTIYTIAQAVGGASLPFTADDFLISVCDVPKWRAGYSVLSQVPDNLPSLEGYFTSGEYNLAGCNTADEAVARLLEPMQKKFEASGWASIDFHNTLTKASLIQKEALFDEDRPLISSVIDNRLQAGAPLQIDAAVKYANNYDEARVYDSHLETDSPYNTYMYAGLPVGPICSGIAEVDIQAALNPTPSDYFYYVLQDTEGHHQFCITPEEFEVAKQQYLDAFGYQE